MLIDISDLPKEKVIIALYKNIVDHSLKWREKPIPTEAEITHLLKTTSGYIHTIGPVIFKIDFSKDQIGAPDRELFYDIVNKPSFDSHILSAAECIRKLRDEIRYENARLFVAGTLQKIIGEDITLCYEFMGSTVFRIGAYQKPITLNIPSPMTEIYLKLISEEKDEFIRQFRSIYQAAYEKGNKGARELSFVERTMSEVFGVTIRLVGDYFTGGVKVCYERADGLAVNFIVKLKVSEIYKELTTHKPREALGFFKEHLEELVRTKEDEQREYVRATLSKTLGILVKLSVNEEGSTWLKFRTKDKRATLMGMSIKGTIIETYRVLNSSGREKFLEELVRQYESLPQSTKSHASFFKPPKAADMRNSFRAKNPFYCESIESIPERFMKANQKP